MPHASRPAHVGRHPVHVTLRGHATMRSFRGMRVGGALGRAFRAAAGAATTCRVVHFSLQPDHIHMIVEAEDRTALSRGLQSLTTRLAIAANRKLGRRGPVFGDRYHARPLCTPREVRNAIVYVLHNFKKHVEGRTIDVFSSAAWFGGWADVDERVLRTEDCPVCAPTTWLLAAGWRRHGLIRIADAPRGASS